MSQQGYQVDRKDKVNPRNVKIFTQIIYLKAETEII